jgi:hypothetical protein
MWMSKKNEVFQFSDFCFNVSEFAWRYCQWVLQSQYLTHHFIIRFRSRRVLCMSLLATGSSSQSHSHFMTGGLPPISSSCRQAPRDLRPELIFSNWTLAVTGNILSDERMCLWFTIAAGPRQRSHSQVRVPLGSSPHFTVSYSRLHQPGGLGPRIYMPQEQGGPVIPPSTGFLLLAGLRWKYSTPPPHGISNGQKTDLFIPDYIGLNDLYNWGSHGVVFELCGYAEGTVTSQST